VFPGYPLSFHALAHSFALFCIPQKLNSFIFKRFRTLCKKTGGWGISAIRKFLRCSWKFNLVKVGNSLRSTTRQSRITSHESRVTKLGLGWAKVDLKWRFELTRERV
jgi:hypothetical protein